MIDHAEKYVDGQIHTNGCENFWSLLKRGLKGTYISVEPFHLFRYVDEEVFRFNTPKQQDGNRFTDMTRRVTGRRVTYKQLTGTPLDETTASRAGSLKCPRRIELLIVNLRFF